MDAKREPSQDLVEKSDRRALITGVEDLEHADTGAVVDGRELIEPLAGTGDALEELHVQLQAVTGLGFFVALPPFRLRPILLIGGQPVHAMPHQDAVHRGHGEGLLMKAPEVVGDPAGAEVIVLPQIQDLADDVARGGSRRPVWRAWPIGEPCLTLRSVSALPAVKRLP